MLMTIRLVRALWRDRSGVTAVEYAVVAAGLIAVAATAFTALGGRLTSTVGNVL